MSTLQLKFLMLIFAGWVNRRQQNVIEYLQEENRVLREHLSGKRLLFTDRQRRPTCREDQGDRGGRSPQALRRVATSRPQHDQVNSP